MGRVEVSKYSKQMNKPILKHPVSPSFGGAGEKNHN
jgi:hypothetical protein